MQTIPLVFLTIFFHRANKAYDKFRHIATSRNTFLRSENGRFYRTRRVPDRIPAALFIPYRHACDRFQIEAAPKPQKAEYMGKYRRFGSSHSAARSCKDNPPALPRFFMATCLCSIGIRRFRSCGPHEPFAPKKVAPPILGRATEPAFIRPFLSLRYYICTYTPLSNV